MTKNLQWLSNRAIAHRGFHTKDIMENTLDAFKLGLQYHFNLECDVRLTKDGQVIIFHDKTLKRLFNLDKNINDCTVTELKNLSNHQLITLNELCQLISGKVGLVVEIKNEGLNQTIVDKVIEVLDKYPYDFAVKSFNYFSLYHLQKKRPQYISGKLFDKSFNFKVLLNQIIGLFVKSDFMSVSSNIRLKRKRSIPILRWTVTSFDTINDEFIPVFEQIPVNELQATDNPLMSIVLDEDDSYQ